MSRSWPLTVTAGLVGVSSLAVALLQHDALEKTRAKLERAEQRAERLMDATATSSVEPCFDTSARAALPVAARAAPAEPSAAGVAVLTPSERAVEVPDEEMRSDAQVLFEYEEAFLAQPPDRDFQRLEETRLGLAITRLLDRADHADGIACRASMCRTRLSLPNEQHYRAFMSRFGDSAPPWLGETMLRREPTDGDGVTLWIYYTASDRTDGAS